VSPLQVGILYHSPVVNVAAARRTMNRLLARLVAAHGPRPWKCWGRGVGVLVDTILSQNTSAANSDAGYRQLRRALPTWNKVADAPVDQVERAIRVSGLSRLKAPRIQAILRQLRAERGRIDLQFLNDLDEQAAYDYLMKFAGIGPKTANCVLMFAFGKPVFPVDTHIRRIARRLGLIPPNASAERAHELLKPMIEPEDRYAMHVLLIEHGRTTCRAINPNCGDCTLLDMCPEGQRRVRQRKEGRTPEEPRRLTPLRQTIHRPGRTPARGR
jgi:endonuclease-3